jgi:heterodisulfide reductase subunit A-like polyferredoxin
MIINRRDLLVSGSAATALATGSLVASDDAKAQAAQPAVVWDHDADVVVIGSGAAGLPAAIVAREAGPSPNALRRASAAFAGERATIRRTFPACREYETVADWP